MTAPRVTIVLPTYNRAGFLPSAFASITQQTLVDWELVVIDDGSTDDSHALLERLRRDVPQAVTIVRQANAGAYGARNTALDHARAPLVAFFDSDDIWLPHHLQACVDALDAAPAADWVYAACRMVDATTGTTIADDTFRLETGPRPFTTLATETVGRLHIFRDRRTVACALRFGLYCGLQNSVIRCSVFDGRRFRTNHRNEAEDQLFLIRALKEGITIGYLDDVHVEYRVHAGNSSGAATDTHPERQLRVYQPVVQGFEELWCDYAWYGRERRALRQRVAREHFWHVGYAVLWRNGRRQEAMRAFQAGLRAWPWSAACWKTYLLARLRLAFG